MINSKSVTIATVTYGNRWEYLKQVIGRVFSFSEVDRMVIVDNGTSYDLQKKIDENFKSYSNRISFVKSLDTGGSASGFYQAIKEAYAIYSEYIMLLDDDNLPEKNLFKNLNTDSGEIFKNKKNVIAFYRDRYFKDMFEKRITYKKERYENSYCKFSIINKIYKKRYTERLNDSNFCPVVYAQYSGLLLKTEIINEIGYPNRNFFLYVDDTDYTYRITKAGYNILAYRNGKIRDLEKSWSQIEDEKEVDPHLMIFQQENPERGLYYIRNRVYFELNNLVTNKFLYNVNRVIYYTAIFIKFMPKNKKGFLLFKQMIKVNKDASTGKLGKFSN
ncbi:glycosyltransferase [Latilactobacillus curvatus]